MNMNEETARLLSRDMIYPNGAQSPTECCLYTCPCGNGTIEEERSNGFNEDVVYIQCKVCAKKYRVVYGGGHRWELKELLTTS
jgi:hypothetical protein